MHETHGCAPARKTWGAIGVCGPYEICLLRCNYHMRSPGSLCLLAQYSMNHVYPRVLESAPSDAVWARADAVWALKQPMAIFSDRYGANTGPVEPTSMGAVWTMHYSLRAQNPRKPISESSTCSSLTHRAIRIQQSSKNRTNQQRGHPPSLIRVSLCA